MIFITYKKWEQFCSFLAEHHIYSEILDAAIDEIRFLALKHDVETNVKKALKTARIEAKYGQKASYYVQAYLLNDPQNIAMLKEIRSLGHLVSYHYDVLDQAEGDFLKAREIFERELLLFQENEFDFKTVCQHGNPLVKRQGYTSNRDFFRSEKIQQTYNYLDVMVNMRNQMSCQDYLYVSDYGYGLSIIPHPETADIESESKNTQIGWEELQTLILKNCVIFSSHPHRFYSNMVEAYVKYMLFWGLKKITKILVKVPGIKIIIYRNYHLAKKI